MSQCHNIDSNIFFTCDVGLKFFLISKYWLKNYTICGIKFPTQFIFYIFIFMICCIFVFMLLPASFSIAKNIRIAVKNAKHSIISVALRMFFNVTHKTNKQKKTLFSKTIVSDCFSIKT